MAAINSLSATLADWGTRRDPNGALAQIAELLTIDNEVLMDMPWVEGNLPTGHKTTVRTGLPSAAWRKLNYGVPKSKSTTSQQTDVTGMLEAYSEVDKSLSDLNGGSKEWRLSEETAFLEAMNLEFVETLFYGNEKTDDAKFTGLAPRYPSLSGYAASKNVISYGGSGSENTSIWLLGWGERTMHGIFPKGSMAGLHAKDLGEKTIFDANGGMYQGLRTHFKWDCGFSLRDWRYASRICNIDTTTFDSIITDAAAIVVGMKLIRMMIKAQNLIPTLGAPKQAFYMNNDCKTVIDILAMEKNNVQLQIEDFAGKKVTTFRGTPIRRVDSLLNTEQALV